MSLVDDIDKIYSELQNYNKIDFDGIKEGKSFAIKLVRDFVLQNQLIVKHGLEQDKRGWLKRNPFPLTIEIINRDETPGTEVHLNRGYRGFVVVYYGLCPELENFVNITLWPQSNTSKTAYKKIYRMIKEDKERKRVLAFDKNYGFLLPNSLRPYNDLKLDTIEKPKHVYDWLLVPFLKETGDSILAHSSPLNFKKVYLDQVRHQTSYVHMKMVIGRINSISGKFVEILIPSLYGRWIPYRTRISDEAIGIIENLGVGSLNNFLIMRKLNNNVENVVKDVYPALPIDLVAHFLGYVLYTFKINTDRLCLMTFNEYDKIYKKCVDMTLKFCIREKIHNPSLWTSRIVFEAYLTPYFRIIENKIFAVPCNQHHLSDDMIKIYDKHFEEGTEFMQNRPKLLFDDKGMIIKTKSHNPLFNFIKFFNALNKLLKNNDSRKYVFDKMIKEISR